MNALPQILKLPWKATSFPSLFVVGVTLIVIGGIIGPLAGWASVPHWFQICTGLCGIAIAAIWLLVVPNALWLARDGRTLRLPRIARYADWSLAVYAVLTVVIPAMALGMIGGHTGLLLGLFAAIAAGCMAWQLLPLRAASVLLISAIIMGNLHRAPLPTTLRPEPDVWIGALAVALVALAGWRWFRLSRGQIPLHGAWGPPLIMAYGHRRTLGVFDMLGHRSDAFMARNGAAWLQPVPDLRRVGLASPALAIRVALGRGLMPKTFASHLRQWTPAGLVFVLWGIIWAISGEGTRHDLTGMFFSQSGWFWLAVGGVVAASLSKRIILATRNRWSPSAAELPLLALLPGLGTPRMQKRSVFDATLKLPALWLVAAWLIAWGLAVAFHAPAVTYAFVLLVAIANMGWLCASVLGHVGGTPMSKGASALLWIGFLFLIVFTVVLGIQPQDDIGATAVMVVQIMLLVIWLAWIVFCAVRAWRGWRALQHRPHPFLANES